MNKRIAIGSQVFFGEYEDYESHDRDFVEFTDDSEMFRKFMCKKENGDDVFYYKIMTKEEMLDYELNYFKNIPMTAGKYLVPELVEYLGITIEDLKLFEEFFNRIDDKHLYQKKIYEFYIKNGDFRLTKTQKDKAYQIYKENRKLN